LFVAALAIIVMPGKLVARAVAVNASVFVCVPAWFSVISAS